MIKYDLWPTTRGLSKALLKERITAYLSAKGLSAERLAFRPLTKHLVARQPGSTQGEDPFMLLRHHSLSSAARQHFKVPRDPFINELNEDADAFITDDIRYVRSHAPHGTPWGDAGGGGRVGRRQVHPAPGHDRLDQHHGERVTVIEPYVIGMEDSHRRGKALMAADITGAVIRTVARPAPPCAWRCMGTAQRRCTTSSRRARRWASGMC